MVIEKTLKDNAQAYKSSILTHLTIYYEWYPIMPRRRYVLLVFSITFFVSSTLNSTNMDAQSAYLEVYSHCSTNTFADVLISLFCYILTVLYLLAFGSVYKVSPVSSLPGVAGSLAGSA